MQITMLVPFCPKQALVIHYGDSPDGSTNSVAIDPYAVSYVVTTWAGKCTEGMYQIKTTPSPYTLHGVYYFKDRDSRSDVRHCPWLRHALFPLLQTNTVKCWK